MQSAQSIRKARKDFLRRRNVYLIYDTLLIRLLYEGKNNITAGFVQ